MDSILFESKQDAEKVMSAIRRIFEQYKLLTSADVKSLAGIKHDYKDSQYGWKSLDGIDIRPTPKGHAIDFPTVVPI